MDELKALTFEAAAVELEVLVQKLEEGELPLEETVSCYQRGQLLAQHCQSLLDDVELRIQELAPDGEGGYRARALELPEEVR
ncbi:MAG TPA: exodeoxyribonuclease VII small subunit [Thermoflexia bacterium]|nr:exodeoxyribonuclease VII small subunit [Thermoflexia bacterium]